MKNAGSRWLLAGACSVTVLAATLAGMPDQARAMASQQSSLATGQQVTLSQAFGSVTVNTGTGSLTNLFLRNPDGSLPAQSLTGTNSIGTSVADALGRQYESALGAPASVTVGRDSQTGAVTSVKLDGIPLTASQLLGSTTVGRSPNSVAFAPDGQTAYVTNFGSGSITAVPVNVVPYNASPTADWIWNTPNSGSSAAAGTIYLRKTFTTPQGVTQASLRINTDNSYVAYVNGNQVTSGNDWTTSQYADITNDLNPVGQPNVIAVAATNAGVSPAGMIAAIQFDGTSPQQLVTDTSWKAWPSSAASSPVSSTPPASNWNTVGYDDSAWEDAFLTGPYGTAPWNTLSDAGAAITVGGSPSGIVVAPNGDLLVDNYSENELQEVNPSSRSIVKTIPVGVHPQWPALTPDGKTLLVPNAGSDSVTAVDITTGTVEATIPVGSAPIDIAIPPGGSRAYVTNLSSNSVTPIDLATLEPLPDISVGSGPIAAAATPDGQNIVISLSTAGAVVLLNVATGQVSAPINVGGNPYAIAISPDGSTAYVNDSPGEVVPIRLATRTVLPALPAGAFPNGNAISPNGKYLLSADYSGSTVSRYDLQQVPPSPVTEDWALTTTHDGGALQWTITQHWQRDFAGSADDDPTLPFAPGITSTVWYNPADMYTPNPDKPPFRAGQSTDHSETLGSTGQGPASGGSIPADTWAVYKLWSRYHLASDLRLGVSGGYLTRSASQYGYVSDAGASFEPGQAFTAGAGTARSLTLTLAAPDKYSSGYQLDASIPDAATLSSLQDFYQSLLNGGTVAGQTAYLFGNEVAGYITGYEALPDGTALNVGMPTEPPASSDGYPADAAFRNYLEAMLGSVNSNGQLIFGLSSGSHYQDTALWALLGLYQYTIHTGNLALYRSYQPVIARMLSFWTNKIQSNGLVLSSSSDGNYYDAINFGSTYYSTYINAFVYEVLENMADLEHGLSEQDAAVGLDTQAQQEATTAQGYASTAAGIKNALNTVMWTPGSPNGPMYADWIDNDNGQHVYSFMDAAQYPAIVFGIADHTQATEILSTADARLAQLPSLDGYTGMGTPNVLWPLPAYANSNKYAFGDYMNGGMFLYSTYYEVMARAMSGDTAGAYARLSAFAQGFMNNSWWGTNWAHPSGAVDNSNGNEPYLQDMLLTASSLTQGILGIRGTWDALSVTPALPSGWESAQTSILYRGSPYCVTISNGTAATTHGACHAGAGS
jgi:YVTN family beta-propeller protein